MPTYIQHFGTFMYHSAGEGECFIHPTNPTSFIKGIRRNEKPPSRQDFVNPIDLDLFLMFENLEKARPNH
jgi:hypothetical protein